MKLPEFFHKLGSISIPIFVVSFLATISLGVFFASNLSGPVVFLKSVLLIVTGLSFVTMIFSTIAAPQIRVIQNAALRRFGQPATAKVLDFYGIKTGTIRGLTEYAGVRVKLEVHLPDGGTFGAVTEDTFDAGLQLRQGESIPVKYDPGTKQVALVMPAKEKAKKKDF